MSIDSVRTAIEQRFYDNWTGTSVDTNVRFSNAPFKAPENASWASIDVAFITTRNITISSNLPVRRRGRIIIDVYGSIDSGTGGLATLSDEAISIFENKQFSVPSDAVTSYVNSGGADVRHIGVPNAQGTDPQWYKFSIRIPFYRDE